jgi:hypothetical protein
MGNEASSPEDSPAAQEAPLRAGRRQQPLVNRPRVQCRPARRLGRAARRDRGQSCCDQGLRVGYALAEALALPLASLPHPAPPLPAGTVPTGMRWPHGGKTAFICGSFTQWQKMPMQWKQTGAGGEWAKVTRARPDARPPPQPPLPPYRRIHLISGGVRHGAHRARPAEHGALRCAPCACEFPDPAPAQPRARPPARVR